MLFKAIMNSRKLKQKASSDDGFKIFKEQFASEMLTVLKEFFGKRITSDSLKGLEVAFNKFLKAIPQILERDIME